MKHLKYFADVGLSLSVFLLMVVTRYFWTYVFMTLGSFALSVMRGQA